MDTKILKVLLGSAIYESELSNVSKLQLLKFVKEEATDAQIKALLLDGKITRLDEQAEKIVEDRFKNSKIYKKLNEGQVASILGMLTFSPVVWAMWRLFRATISKKQRQCGILSVNSERDKCLKRVAFFAIIQKINMLKKMIGDANKSKNPQKYKEKLEKKILNLNNKAKVMSDKYKLKWGEELKP